MAGNNLYYDAHAKNVIVKCKDGKNLESLIENGEIGSSDPSDDISIICLSTIPNMQNTEDSKYTFISNLRLSISGSLITFYMYFKNINKNENIPIGTIIIAEYDNIITISSLGGSWESLGRIELNINNNNNTNYYAYKKIG